MTEQKKREPRSRTGWPTTPETTANRRANMARATATGSNTAARWPTGAGPIVHGGSSHMAARCRALNGRACPTCRDGQAAYQATRRARGQD